MPGSYLLKPIEAKLTRDTEFIGRMSPYCSFQIGEKVVSSTICKKGGKHPQWKDVLTISAPIDNDSILNVQVMDKDTLLADDQIGSFSLSLKEIECAGQVSKWYTLFFKEKPAGEILLETTYNELDSGFPSTRFEEKTATTSAEVTGFEAKTKVYQEQKQVVESRTFTKDVDVVDIIPTTQKIEVMEPVKVMKDVEYTEVVPVKKEIETIEPQVVKKKIEVMEPKLVTKTIQVVENVPVTKEVEVIENKTVVKEVETFEPQTFTKQIEVTDYVPVTKEVEVSEPVHVKKAVEFVEPVITTQTITKEIKEPVIVNQDVKTTVGPASMIHAEDKIMKEKLVEKKSKKSKKIQKIDPELF